MDDALLAQAAGEWPELRVPKEVFAAYLADRLAGANEEEAKVIRAHAADLYLACACARGDERAAALLARQHLAKLGAQLAHMNLSASMVDEVRQQLSERLLVGNRKIAEYRGAGPLGSWVRVCAVREALDLLRQRRPEADLDEADSAQLLVGPDPELEYTRQRYAGEFKSAFRDAMAALPKREQLFLRLRYLDGLNIDQIAQLEGIGRSTAARWLVECRRLLLEGTLAQLNARLGLSADEADSLARLLRSRIDVSLRSLFEHAR